MSRYENRDMIHPKTLTDVAAGSRVIVRDARGDLLERVAASTVKEGANFLVVWVSRPEEWAAALQERRDPEQVPWPAEDVWLPGDEPRAEAPGDSGQA